jgi:hypothetical protein
LVRDPYIQQCVNVEHNYVAEDADDGVDSDDDVNDDDDDDDDAGDDAAVAVAVAAPGPGTTEFLNKLRILNLFSNHHFRWDAARAALAAKNPVVYKSARSK